LLPKRYPSAEARRSKTKELHGDPKSVWKMGCQYLHFGVSRPWREVHPCLPAPLMRSIPARIFALQIDTRQPLCKSSGTSLCFMSASAELASVRYLINAPQPSMGVSASASSEAFHAPSRPILSVHDVRRSVATVALATGLEAAAEPCDLLGFTHMCAPRV
jgi:hypothetical protein